MHHSPATQIPVLTRIINLSSCMISSCYISSVGRHPTHANAINVHNESFEMECALNPYYFYDQERCFPIVSPFLVVIMVSY